MNGAQLRATLLREGSSIADGGMATSLVARGTPIDACFEELNVRAPRLVEEVHRSFVAAGARLVWTNTFAANRIKLDRHGLREQLQKLNRTGVEIARRTGALVAGAAGPLGVRLAPYGRVSADRAREVYAEQLAVLAEAGVDIIAIETQTDLSEMEQALAAARDAASDVGVVVTATFAEDDRTPLGSTPADVAMTLRRLGADAIGVNCGRGPAQVLRIVRAMREAAPDTPIVARPNAGGPTRVGGRLLYPATPSYFADSALALREEGAELIGGCCGVDPSHISAMSEALSQSGSAAMVAPHDVPELPNVESPRSPASFTQPTELARKLATGRFVVAVEVEPPRGFSAARVIAAAETLSQAGADVIDVADSPLAKLRMSPWAACRLIHESTPAETVLHFPTRGRNLLRLQGDLLAVHALGIGNVFVCLGDPVTVGDFPGGSDSVDVTPTGLVGLITRSFNQGMDQAGSSIGEATRFVVGCALSPGRNDCDAEVELLKRKVDAGASFALTQPLFGLAPLAAVRRRYEDRFGPLTLPLLAGVLPLVSSRHAEFLDNEVPGLHVPEDVLRRMRRAGVGAEREGLTLASELVDMLASSAAGVYVMPQFGRFDLAAEVVEVARRVGDASTA